MAGQWSAFPPEVNAGQLMAGDNGASIAAAAAAYEALAAALQLLAAWVQQSAVSAAGIEQAYVTAKTAMIPVPVCTSNRTTWTGLAMTNFCGINFPPMGVLDGLYEGYWLNNAGQMGG